MVTNDNNDKPLMNNLTFLWKYLNQQIANDD